MWTSATEIRSRVISGSSGSRVRRHLAGGVFPPLAFALVAQSWIALLVWNASPYGRYLNHGDWTTLGYAGALCAALPEGGAVLSALLYATGWVVMSAAM